MNDEPATLSLALRQLRDWMLRTDVFLLLFLLLFTVDSVAIKPVALGLAIIYLIRQLPKLKYKDAPLFYLLMPAMEVVRFFAFNRDFSSGHLASFTIGICYWLMGYTAFLIIRYRTEKGGVDKITHTLTTWFFINAACSFGQLLATMKNAGSINPYGLADVAYGNSTGDYIKGAMLAPCYINMFVNSFFAVWFLYQKKWGRALLAMLMCCLTTTNFANIIFLPVLLVLLFVLKQKKARLTIAAGIGLFLVFSVLISSGNINYIKESVNNVSIEKMSISAADADTANKSVKADSARQASKRITAIYSRLAKPNGKVLSWKETWAYAIAAPAHAAFGAGMGNFSSLLALRTAHIYGRKHSRFYDHIPEYVHPAYRANHYQIMKDVYALPEGYHSARHMPHSFPNQLVGEYGLLGIIFFVFGYVWYFLKRGVGRGYFLVMLFLTGGYLWFDYLFEYLSVMVFFELFFWLHRSSQINASTNA